MCDFHRYKMASLVCISCFLQLNSIGTDYNLHLCIRLLYFGVAQSLPSTTHTCFYDSLIWWQWPTYDRYESKEHPFRDDRNAYLKNSSVAKSWCMRWRTYTSNESCHSIPVYSEKNDFVIASNIASSSIKYDVFKQICFQAIIINNKDVLVVAIFKLAPKTIWKDNLC